jgi:hypothetical protein
VSTLRIGRVHNAGEASAREVEEADPVGTDRDAGHASAGLVDHVEQLAGRIFAEVLASRRS